MEDNWTLITAFPSKILPYSIWDGVYEAIRHTDFEQIHSWKLEKETSSSLLTGKSHGQGAPGVQSMGCEELHMTEHNAQQLKKDYFNIFLQLSDTTLNQQVLLLKASCQVMTRASKLSIHCILIYLVPSLKNTGLWS